MFRLFCFFFFFLDAWAGSLTSLVQETYQDLPAFQVSFTQKTTVELLEKTIEERGTLLFSRPNRFVIHYQGRRERKYLSNGKTLWVLRPKEKELETYPDSRQWMSREGLVFLGRLDSLEEEFQVKEVADKNSPELHLSPKNKESLFKRIELKINPKTGWVEEALLFPKQGNQTHYFFGRVEKKRKVSDAFFQP